MPSKMTFEDPVVLELKIKDIHRLICNGESLLQHLKSEQWIATARSPINALGLVQALVSPQMPKFFESPLSLIAPDIQRVIVEMGPDFNDRFNSLQKAVDSRIQMMCSQSRSSSDPIEGSEFDQAITHYCLLIEVWMIPLCLLRDQLSKQLVDARANSNAVLTTHTKKQMRNERLRQLRDCQPSTITHRQLTELALSDAEIKTLGQPVTPDIVRAATRSRAGKKLITNPRSRAISTNRKTSSEWSLLAK